MLRQTTVEYQSSEALHPNEKRGDLYYIIPDCYLLSELAASKSRKKEVLGFVVDSVKPKNALRWKSMSINCLKFTY